MDYDWSSFTVSFEICTSLSCVVKLSKYHRINMSSKVYICKLMMARSHELNAIVFHKDVLEYIYAHNKILCSVMDASCKWVSLAFPGNQWERVWKRRRVCQTIVFATFLRTEKKQVEWKMNEPRWVTNCEFMNFEIIKSLNILRTLINSPNNYYLLWIYDRDNRTKLCFPCQASETLKILHRSHRPLDLIPNSNLDCAHAHRIVCSIYKRKPLD